MSDPTVRLPPPLDDPWPYDADDLDLIEGDAACRTGTIVLAAGLAGILGAASGGFAVASWIYRAVTR